MKRSSLEKELRECFDSLKNNYPTKSHLIIKEGYGSDFYDPVKNEIVIFYKKESIDKMKWILAHEYGHAVEYSQNPELLEVMKRTGKRALLICIPMIIAVTILIILNMTDGFLPTLVISGSMIFAVKNMFSKSDFRTKQESEIFADNFANQVVGGGAHAFSDSKWMDWFYKICKFFFPVYHPSDRERKSESLKYPPNEYVRNDFFDKVK